MLLSIIVPVYNVEKYLRKCVDSLLAQDLLPEEYEIILVDDGSTDQGGRICDEYAMGHPNVKVLHQQNGGLSAARNNGIDAAEGKYIQFVDSDDYLEPNVLKALVEIMEKDDLDVLRFNYQNVNEDGEIIFPFKDPKRSVDYSNEVCDGLTFLSERLGPACYACQFMILRELLDHCRFIEGAYFEDMRWTPQILLNSRRVSSSETVVYYYLIRSGSITKSEDEEKKKKVVHDLLSVIDDFKRQKQNIKDQRWFDSMIGHVTLSIINYVSANCYDKKKEVVLRLKEKKVFPLSSYHVSKMNQLKLLLANISPHLLFFYLRFRKMK